MVLKVLTMTDEKTKQKAIEAAADIFGMNPIYFSLMILQHMIWLDPLFI